MGSEDVVMVPRKNASEAIYDCIRDVFVEVLGSGAAETVLCQLKWNDLADARDFSESLEDIFGSGAVALEKYVLERLYSLAGKQFMVKQGYVFADYINEISLSLSS